MAQLHQTFPNENWKPRFSRMSQKLKIVFNFFPINFVGGLVLPKKWTNYTKPSQEKEWETSFISAVTS